MMFIFYVFNIKDIMCFFIIYYKLSFFLRIVLWVIVGVEFYLGKVKKICDILRRDFGICNYKLVNFIKVI